MNSDHSNNSAAVTGSESHDTRADGSTAKNSPTEEATRRRPPSRRRIRSSRARFATGREALPAAATTLSVDEYLGEHTDGTVRRAAADGGVVPAGESEHAEVIDDDTGVWEGPHTEYDRYGQPTGHEYVRCRNCGVEVLADARKAATHRAGCTHE